MDDLLILARDGEFYRFPKDEARKRTLPTSMTYQVGLLVEQGVVLADVPLGSIPGVGLMCFLLNLSAIQRRPESEPKSSMARTASSPAPRAEEGLEEGGFNESEPTVDDLVVRFSGGQDFYWVKRSEYQNPWHKLSPSEQLSALAEEGVLVAAVPEKSIAGLESGFCLVNLKAILRPAAKAEVEEKLAQKMKVTAEERREREILMSQDAEGQSP